MSYTHADLSAAIDKARGSLSWFDEGADGDRILLDTLTAILRIHHPLDCEAECADPCPYLAVVADTLDRMGIGRPV